MMWFRIVLRAYDVAVTLFTWTVLAPWSWLEVARGRALAEDREVRLRGAGAAPPTLTGDHAAAPDAPALTDGTAAAPIVIHAVSLGELQAARALVLALAARAPEFPVVVSCGTSDALSVARGWRNEHPNVRDVCPLPWDRRTAVRRWLANWRPKAVLFVEAELWPTMITECARAGIPVCIVSGRLTERDARRYAWVRPFFARVFEGVRLVAVQDEVQRRRFLLVGMPTNRLTVLGDLKGDTPPAQPVPMLASVTAAPLVVFGNVRIDEEHLAVTGWQRVIAAHPTARLVVAPRHARRARGLESRLRDVGLSPVSFEAAVRQGLPDGCVAVVDRPGWLAAIYASADVAVVGGSFGRTGAHSVFEPARGGAAIVVGPSRGAMTEAIAQLQAVGGVLSVEEASADQLATALVALLSDPARRQRLVAGARAWLDARAGAAARTAAAVLERVN